jgi:hypothetical protein
MTYVQLTCVNMQSSQNQNQTGESRIGRDTLKPIVVLCEQEASDMCEKLHLHVKICVQTLIRTILNRTICGSVARKMRSPNFSTLSAAWKGNASSDPFRTMFGKSRQ